jgi:hypothetical protein
MQRERERDGMGGGEYRERYEKVMRRKAVGFVVGMASAM